MARKNTATRKTRDTFYIITNGEKTEKNYFTLLKSKKSIYDVKIKTDVADPLQLVKFSLQYLNEANQIWCVFDVDNSHEEHKLMPALELAEKKGVKIAFSNKAFEVWLISHYKQCSKEMECTDLIKELTKYLKDNYNQEYSKNDEEILKKYFIPHYKDAVQNAKIVYQKRMKEFRNELSNDKKPPIWQWNSCTTVFKLIEALKLQE